MVVKPYLILIDPKYEIRRKSNRFIKFPIFLFSKNMSLSEVNFQVYLYILVMFAECIWYDQRSDHTSHYSRWLYDWQIIKYMCMISGPAIFLLLNLRFRFMLGKYLRGIFWGIFQTIKLDPIQELCGNWNVLVWWENSVHSPLINKCFGEMKVSFVHIFHALTESDVPSSLEKTHTLVKHVR